VALRYSRPVKALIATGVAASAIVMAGLPAAADTVRNGEWWMSALAIRNAWPVSRGEGVTVAVLSDGVDAQQPDVSGQRLTIGPDFTGTGQSSGPYYGEIGTGIAALIGGHGYGLQGYSGVLGEVPLAQILSVRVTLPPNDPMLAQSAVAARLPGAIAQGIRYAVKHGASVIDLPLDPGQAGITGQGGASAAAGGSAAELAAVKYALSRNVVLVAPAGDDELASDAPNYPAAYPGVIAVGAFNHDFTKAPWSSHQSYVTVTAAGSGLLLPTNSGTFTSQSSTVYASAAVTGIVAMMEGRFPGITIAQVRQALIAGAMFRHRGGLADGSGYGAVNAQQALAAAEVERTSAATLAGAGAQPLASQPSPQPGSSHQSLVSSIIKAAIISAALLVILLLLIGFYAASGRRRAARQRQAVAADWSRLAQPRHSRAGGPEANRMLEFFAAPVAGQAAARPGAVAASAPRANGTFPATGLPTAISRDPFGASPAPAPSASWDAADAGGRSSLGPASRAVTRRPSVSGAPPWDDASRPQGELPWAAPATPAAAGAAATPAAPADAAAAAAGGGSGPSGWDPAAFRRSAAPAAGGAAAPSFRSSPAGSALSDPHSRPALPGPALSGPALSGPALSGPALSGPALSGSALSGSALSGPAEAGPPQFEPPQFGPPQFGPPQFGPPQFGPAGSGSAQAASPATGLSQALSPTGSGQWDRAPQPPPADAYRPTPTREDFPQAGQPGQQGSGRPGQSMTGRLDWGRSPGSDPSARDGSARNADSGGHAAPRGQAPGGPLPVRQPRHSAPREAMSPSGSLWERAADPAGTAAESGDAGSRPIYTWNPGDGPDSAGSESAELAAEAPTWRLRGRAEPPPRP
jgi:Subtilase family